MMATDKRDRQRANREEKKAEQAKVKRRQEAYVRIRKWAIYAVLIAASLVLFTLVFR
ncbi:MAG: hypothetical protein BMS9Abin07_1088 [Acidimicrobiia bacterium]|nr:MAG: hypothetical protein BMS9Abin07_1088 [Acidimicrobiia bacterium]